MRWCRVVWRRWMRMVSSGCQHKWIDASVRAQCAQLWNLKVSSWLSNLQYVFIKLLFYNMLLVLQDVLQCTTLVRSLCWLSAFPINCIECTRKDQWTRTIQNLFLKRSTCQISARCCSVPHVTALKRFFLKSEVPHWRVTADGFWLFQTFTAWRLKYFE